MIKVEIEIPESYLDDDHYALAVIPIKPDDLIDFFRDTGDRPVSLMKKDLVAKV